LRDVLDPPGRGFDRRPLAVVGDGAIELAGTQEQR
jgi:hypothetical protein